MSEFPVFRYSKVIREGHLDTFGHVNNAVYLQLFEEARWEASTQNGYGLKEIVAAGAGPTILELKLKFFKEIRLRDNIVIESQLLSYPTKVGVMRQQIKNSKGDLCCEMEMTFGLFDTRERKLIEPTPAWKKAVCLEPSPT